MKPAATSQNSKREEKHAKRLPPGLPWQVHKVCENSPTMRELKLGLQPGAISVVAEALASNTHLETLHLDGSALGEGNLELLCSGLTENHSLKALSLRGTGIKADGMPHLCKALAHHTSLRHLDLSSNLLGDEGLASICGALASLQHQLEVIRLSDTGITDAGLDKLLQSLSKCQILQWIDLNDNLGITSGSAFKLTEFKTKIKTNASFCLDCNTIRRGSLGKALKAIHDRDALLSFGVVSPSKARLLLCGDQFVGKTSLAISLCPDDREFRGRLQRKRTCVKQSVPQDAADRTRGVDIRSITLQGGGEFTLYDLAGQSQYITPHSLVAGGSAAVLVLVLSLGDDAKTRLTQFEYWLRFLKARFVPASPEQLPIVHVVLTHRDLQGHHPADVSYLTDRQEWVSSWGESVVGHFRKKFEKSLAIDPHVYVVDALEPNDSELDLLREKLRESRQTVLSHTGKVPLVVEKMKEELYKMREACKAWPVQTEEDFWRTLQELNSSLPNPCGKDNDRTVISAAMRFLEAEGELVWIEKARLVVLSPPFFCSAIVGRLFAPEWFPVCVEQVAAGRVSVDAIAAAFTRRDADHVLAMVRELDLGFEDTPDIYLVPALLDQSQPQECAWAPAEGACTLGRRLLCTAETDYFGPSFFHRLQVCLRKIFGGHLRLWRDGADGTKAGVRCHVLSTFNGQGVDVWAQGPANSGQAALTIVSEIEEQIQQVMEHDCANIQPIKLALSPTQLRITNTTPASVPGYLLSVLESTPQLEVPPTHPPGPAPIEKVQQLLGRRQKHAFTDLWPCKAINLGADSKLRILVVRSNPWLHDDVLETEREERYVREAMQRAAHTASFEFHSIGDVHPSHIHRAMRDFRPHCVHFVGHYTDGRGFECVDEQRYSCFLTGEQFCAMVRTVQPPLSLACVVVNCCSATDFAKAVMHVAKATVCPANPISDSAGMQFASLFWHELLVGGSDLAEAFKQAHAAALRQNEEDAADAEDTDEALEPPQYTLFGSAESSPLPAVEGQSLMVMETGRVEDKQVVQP